MNTKNVLIGGIAGGIAYFFLGWLIYGIILMDYMMSISPFIPGMNRSESEFVWWAMIASNIFSGLFVAFVFDKAKVSGWMDGLKTAGIMGFLISCSYNLSFYAMTNMVSRKGMLVDSIAGAVLTGIGGIVIAIVMDKMGKK